MHYFFHFKPYATSETSWENLTDQSTYLKSDWRKIEILVFKIQPYFSGMIFNISSQFLANFWWFFYKYLVILFFCFRLYLDSCAWLDHKASHIVSICKASFAKAVLTEKWVGLAKIVQEIFFLVETYGNIWMCLWKIMFCVQRFWREKLFCGL